MVVASRRRFPMMVAMRMVASVARLFPLAALAITAVSVSAVCGMPTGGDDPAERLRKNVDIAADRGVTAYWLGESFSAGQITVDHVEPSDYSPGKESLGIHYFDGEQDASLTVRSIAPAAAEQWKMRARTPGARPATPR